jgi:DNA processing protein
MSRGSRHVQKERDEWLAALTLAHLASEGSRVPLSFLHEHPPVEILRAGPATLRRWHRSLLESAPGAYRSGSWVERFVAQRVTFDSRAAEKAALQSGVEFVPCSSESYPPALRQLPEPPAGLFVKGSKTRALALLHRPTVTIVGTRRATPYGTRVTELIARSLAGAGVTVLSGLALGVDVCAHRGCLSVSGGTVAVLAAGPDRAYPHRHAAIHERISRLGAVVGEVPPGAALFPWRFLLRNRILAALGDAVIVTEAGERSGALNTVEWALGLGRTVFAVPGPILSGTSTGVNRLLAAGATPCVDPDAVVEDFLHATRMDRQARRAGEPGKPTVEAVMKPSRSRGARDSGGAEERLVVLALSRGPCTVDDVSRSVGLSTREVNITLGLLEAQARAKRIGQGRYVLV